MSSSRSAAVLALAIVALACATPLIRWASPAPAMTVAAGRVSLTAVVLWVIGGGALTHLRNLGGRERALVVISGLLLGAHFGLWITSLYFTSAAASLALVAMNPVFAALFGMALGDRPSRREWGGIAIAAIGCLALAGGDWQAGGRALLGDCLALAGAATAAAYLVVGRRLRTAMPLFPYLAVVNTIAGASLIAWVFATGTRVQGLPGMSWLAIGLSAIVSSVFGHTLLNRAVRTTPTHLVALAILGEPVGASLLVWIFFAERPPAHAVVGGAIILIGIALGFVGKAR
jgi:drug/metabolite transporter (DMT)-like permease